MFDPQSSHPLTWHLFKMIRWSFYSSSDWLARCRIPTTYATLVKVDTWLENIVTSHWLNHENMQKADYLNYMGAVSSRKAVTRTSWWSIKTNRLKWIGNQLEHKRDLNMNSVRKRFVSKVTKTWKTRSLFPFIYLGKIDHCFPFTMWSIIILLFGFVVLGWMQKSSTL